MYKSTIVSLKAMCQCIPDLNIMEDEDYFYAGLEVFSTQNVRIYWSNNIAMARPGVLTSPMPSYSDLYDTAQLDLSREYNGSFIELSPLSFAGSIKRNSKFRYCNPREMNHILMKIHWSAPTPPIDEAKFQALCQQFAARASARILPGEFDPCGMDYLILPACSLDHSGYIIECMHKQMISELYTIDHAWRRYASEAPYYRKRIAEIIQSDARLARIFEVGEEYVARRDQPQDPHVDLHYAWWYNADTYDKLMHIKSGEDRLLASLLGNLY